MNRRNWFKVIGAAGAACLAETEANANESVSIGDFDDCFGVLTDITQCIGCRKCEWACNNQNKLPVQPLATFENKSVFQEHRRPDAGHYTVVNQYPGSNGEEKPVWCKVQCMHCNDPACASACLVSALEKQPNGAVIYDASRCMGCRYCMVACPFQIPTYEYHNALTPQVRKCTLCYERISTGGQAPACVTICPTECMTFGRRGDLLQLAKSRIEKNPERYVNHIYGEHEVGGTSWLYISSQPFTELNLPELPEEAPPRLTEEIQHGIFRYFIPPIALYAVLGGITCLYHEPDENKPGEEGQQDA